VAATIPAARRRRHRAARVADRHPHGPRTDGGAAGRGSAPSIGRRRADTLDAFPTPEPGRAIADRRSPAPGGHAAGSAMLEPLLLTTARVATFVGLQPLTNASGFFFARDERMFFVTSRHVVIDEPSQHFPDRIEIEFHTDAQNLTQSRVLSILLYQDGQSVWFQGSDSGGEVDVAVIELQRSALPEAAVLRCFSPEHLQPTLDEVEVGTALLVVGYPLGFHDTLHHLPVVRHAVIASSFGLRFQGQGYFLTDARTHRGTSGAPVVMRCPQGDPQLPWKLLGVHSAIMDMGTRDLQLDESLGLNCAWYADILLTLTDPAKRAPR
jgi:hypothetical protein